MIEAEKCRESGSIVAIPYKFRAVWQCAHIQRKKFLKFSNTWRAADCKLDYIHYKFQKLGGLHRAASESLSE
jgi:hypothetical protein